ncbi:(2Fe-2S)-binding protein [Actinomadura sp. HBU206391]|uniref:(2Fe-2S)-binding protein n=1 Tax=Actinomadura sp. HBU206391 TaxID=2731692 RepID=UPI00164F6694|nr:(2Fe-2S)-binding protein [Actinomadura sp. HBU206391]MBC6459681.1 (2Fe-2S)-binding protein [Actinomadura sp. HBU206391]
MSRPPRQRPAEPEPAQPEPEPERSGIRRRGFLAGAAVSVAATVGGGQATSAAATSGAVPEATAGAGQEITVVMTVNGQTRRLGIDARVTLLDALRERLGLTGSKKGCDRGQCGACTVHVDGRRVLSCLTLAGSAHGKQVTTIEGVAVKGELHPMQQAFIDHDGLQCGYCTPGQIMSAVALLKEGRAGSAEQIREFMSGNICRCAAVPLCRSNIRFRVVACGFAAEVLPGLRASRDGVLSGVSDRPEVAWSRADHLAQ